MSHFITTISNLNKKGSLSELDETLARAIQQVRKLGKPAKLTYTLDIKPDDADGEMVTIQDSIALKTASPARKASKFYTTEDGKLSRNDPNQPELPIAAVPGGKVETPQPAEPVIPVAVGQ